MNFFAVLRRRHLYRDPAAHSGRRRTLLNMPIALVRQRLFAFTVPNTTDARASRDQLIARQFAQQDLLTLPTGAGIAPSVR